MTSHVFGVGVVGGADSKCLMCLGLLFPFWPLSFVVGFGLGVYCFAALVLVVVFPCCFLVRNFLFWRRHGYLFSGVNVGVWCRLFLLLFCVKMRSALVDGVFVRLPRVIRQDLGVKFVFGYPSVPFIPLLLLGFVFALVFGFWLFG